jgi:hypothetical protein
MPEGRDLPESLQPLARRNALTISDLDWSRGMERLSLAIEGVVGRHDERGWSSRELMLAAAGTIAIAFGTAVGWSRYANPDVPPSITAQYLGIFTSAAPLAVAFGVAAGVGIWGLVRGSRLGVGLTLGFALAAIGEYAPRVRNHDPKLQTMLPLIGAAVAATAAAVATSRLASVRTPSRKPRVPVKVLMLSLAGAALVATATALPFNYSATVWQRDGGAAEPLVIAATVLAVLALNARLPRGVAAGVLLGCAISGAAVWVRYIGVPALEKNQNLTYGGFVGLLGALCILAAGINLARKSNPRRRSARERAHG